MIQPWFESAKLGIFIHWGIYAVNGIPESWSFFNDEISYADYLKQCDGFTATHYDPKAWATLFARIGAQYAVLTTKHHDGVALYDTAENDLSVVKRTPAGRDLIAPYCAALREKGVKVGLYFSHLDWSHPDYAPVPVGERTKQSLTTANFEAWEGGKENAAWKRFVAFQRAQLTEICTRFSPDLLWFDGDWTPPHEWWDFDETGDLLRRLLPNVIINSRLGTHGDYATPEQGQPIARPQGPWEFCVTMNDSWGYQGRDNNYKSVREIVRLFAEVVGMGGNLLLDIGPKADGTIPPEQVERLEAFGAWNTKYHEAIWGTDAGLPPGHCYGASTLSTDRKTLYVFVFDKVVDGFAVKGIRNKIKRVSAVGNGDGGELSFRKIGGADWVNVPGVLWIAVPDAAHDPLATVLKIELEGELDLWTGAGHAITAN
ncbi:MAG: alpha-L-fucosidase [Fibrella sp.]|nr:alpha-L-fucosidase [Armatimonadota bacterium]